LSLHKSVEFYLTSSSDMWLQSRTNKQVDFLF
jgi:hypothetical protein